MNDLNKDQTNQDISDSNMSQNKPDSNLSQQSTENLEKKEPEKNAEQAQEDPNWRAFREARKKDRAEMEAAKKRAEEKEAEASALKAALEATFSKSSPSPQAYQQYYGINQGYEPSEETEEQKIERKVNEIISKKEQEYLKQEHEREQREYPSKLKKDFPDFYQVCSQENLDYLDFHHPEVSRPLHRLSDGYDKWSDTYHAVKKLIPNHSNAKKDSLRADNNTQKPKSISSTGMSPRGEPTKQTWQEVEARRAENWARMQKTLKGV